MDAEAYPSSWPVLLAQLPGKPSRACLALRRRMRAAGVIPVVSGAWMLPCTTAHEDFFEQLREGGIRRGGTRVRAASLGFMPGIEGIDRAAFPVRQVPWIW